MNNAEILFNLESSILEERRNALIYIAKSKDVSFLKKVIEIKKNDFEPEIRDYAQKIEFLLTQEISNSKNVFFTIKKCLSCGFENPASNYMCSKCNSDLSKISPVKIDSKKSSIEDSNINKDITSLNSNLLDELVDIHNKKDQSSKKNIIIHKKEINETESKTTKIKKCSSCGSENPASNYMCSKCNSDLSKISPIKIEHQKSSDDNYISQNYNSELSKNSFLETDDDFDEISENEYINDLDSENDEIKQHTDQNIEENSISEIYKKASEIKIQIKKNEVDFSDDREKVLSYLDSLVRNKEYWCDKDIEIILDLEGFINRRKKVSNIIKTTIFESFKKSTLFFLGIVFLAYLLNIPYKKILMFNNILIIISAVFFTGNLTFYGYIALSWIFCCLPGILVYFFSSESWDYSYIGIFWVGYLPFFLSVWNILLYNKVRKDKEYSISQYYEFSGVSETNKSFIEERIQDFL